MRGQVIRAPRGARRAMAPLSMMERRGSIQPGPKLGTSVSGAERRPRLRADIRHERTPGPLQNGDIRDVA
jgi:hypothetical protein